MVTKKNPKLLNMGWLTGLEPATTGITIRNLGHSKLIDNTKEYSNSSQFFCLIYSASYSVNKSIPYDLIRHSLRQIILLFTLFSPAHADYYLESAIALHAVDWLQTHEIRQSDHYSETNLSLGREPSAAAVNRYFIATGVGLIAAHYLLPNPFNKWLRVAWFLNGLVSTGNNYAIRVRIEF